MIIVASEIGEFFFQQMVDEHRKCIPHLALSLSQCTRIPLSGTIEAVFT